MPGIENKYFLLSAHAPNVHFMTFAPTGVATGVEAGFALGVFRRRAATGTAVGPAFTGLVRGDRVRDVSALGTVNDLLAAWDAALRLARASSRNRQSAGPSWTDLADPRRPLPGQSGRQILQCGANYRSHVVDIVMAERRADLSTTGHNSNVPEDEVRAWAESMMDDRARAGRPYVFTGLPSALCGPYDEIVLPDRGTDHDWELELAAVIGRPARNLTRENALEHVAGYTICNDITTRSLVYRHDLKAIGTDWFAAKNAPTFLPTGPFLVPARVAGDPSKMRIALTHNGITRQAESVADMLFDLPAILVYISSITELGPGDLVLTGSPAGNGAHWGVFLAEDDVLECEITGLGTQRNRCVGQASGRSRGTPDDREPHHPSASRGHGHPRLRAATGLLHRRMGSDGSGRGHRHQLPGRRRLAGALHHPAAQGPEQAPGPGLLRRGERRGRGRPRDEADRPRRHARQRAGRARHRRRRLRPALLRPRRPHHRGLGQRRHRAHRRIEEQESIPVRLSHVVLNSTDPDRTARWYQDVLDFRLSDTLAGAEMGTVMNFMRCNARHHSLAFARGPHVSLHHVSFELRGIDEFMRGSGRVLRNGTRMVWGPGRHLAGSNTFAYFLDPQNNTVEYTTELQELDEDAWHPHIYDMHDPSVQDQWGTANPMNELVAKESFNDIDPGLFTAPPV